MPEFIELSDETKDKKITLYQHNGHLISLAKFCDVCDDHPPKHHTQN